MTRLERFLRARKIKPVTLVREAGVARQHLAKIRFGTMEPRRETIAAIVSALRRLSLEPLTADDVFELTTEESGSWRHLPEAVGEPKRTPDSAASAFLRKYLTGASERRWEAQLSIQPEMATSILAALLIREARTEIDRDASRAAALAHFAIDVCDRSVGDPSWVTHLRGCAAVQHANALRHLGSYADALQVLEAAERDLTQVVTSANDLAQAWYVRAIVRWKQGAFRDAAAGAQRTAVLFELLGDTRRLTYTRVLKASIAFESGDPAIARDALQLAIPELVRLEDYRGLAAGWNSLGTAEGQLGNFKAAKRWLTKAAEAFRRLRVVPEVIRARWCLGYFTAIHENRARGITLLRDAQRAFDELQMPSEAGFVGLDLGEVLLLPPSDAAEAAAVLAKVVALFSASGVQPSVEKALALLRDAAAIERATPALVRSVRSFVHTVEHDPAAVFEAPPA